MLHTPCAYDVRRTAWDARKAGEVGIVAYLAQAIRQFQRFDCLATVMGSSPKGAVQISPPLVTRHSLAETKVASVIRLGVKVFANPANEILLRVMPVWELSVKHSLGTLPM